MCTCRRGKSSFWTYITLPLHPPVSSERLLVARWPPLPLCISALRVKFVCQTSHTANLGPVVGAFISVRRPHEYAQSSPPSSVPNICPQHFGLREKSIAKQKGRGGNICSRASTGSHSAPRKITQELKVLDAQPSEPMQKILKYYRTMQAGFYLFQPTLKVIPLFTRSVWTIAGSREGQSVEMQKGEVVQGVTNDRTLSKRVLIELVRQWDNIVFLGWLSPICANHYCRWVRSEAWLVSTVNKDSN